MKRRNKIIIYVFLSLLLSLLLSFLTSESISPLYGPYKGSNFSLDGTFFSFEAKEILGGKTPYIEIYDHKGLYHLGIDMLGILINKDIGILLLEILFRSVSFFFFLFTLEELELKHRESLLGLFAFILFQVGIGGGNLIGIWLLPFSTLSLFFFVLGIRKKDTYFFFGSFFVGVEASLALNSRPMDAIYVYGLMIFLFFYAIKEKKMPLFYKNLITFFLPFLAIILFFDSIALNGGYFKEMMKAIYFDNFVYAGRRSHIPFDQYIFRPLSFVLTLLSLGVFLYQRKQRKDYMDAMLFISSAAVFLPLIFIARYLSYFLSGISLLSLWVLWSLRSVKERSYLLTNSLASSFLLALSSSLLVLTPVSYFSTSFMDFSSKKDLKDMEILDEIKEAGIGDDDLLAIDLTCSVYTYLDIEVETKYPTNQTWWGTDNEEVINALHDYINERKPTYLLVNKNIDQSLVFLEVEVDYSLLSKYDSFRFDVYQKVA